MSNFKKQLYINYTTNEGIKGALDSSIYLVNNNAIVGKGIEEGFNFTLAGYTDKEKIKLLKLIEYAEFDPVYWEGSNFQEGFKGKFSFVPIISYFPADHGIMYDSIKDSFENFESGKNNLDEIAIQIIRRLENMPYEINNPHGEGTIYLV
jgi:hypothetical protein